MDWKRRERTGSLAVGAALALLPAFALAQKTALEEVIVTANKRSQSLQDVAMTVSAFDEETIRQANLTSADDVAVISPTLTINTNISPFTAAFRIRGIGTSQSDQALEASVGIFVDEVYLPRSGLGMSDLTDIESIEILHGPQGTLYGRNTNAGAINVRTKRPSWDGFEGFLEASAGEYSLQRYVGAVGGPINDTMAYRLSGQIHKRDGFFSNGGAGDDLNDADDWNVIGKLLIEPNEKLSILLNGSIVERQTTCCAADAIQSEPVNAQLTAEGFAPDASDPFDFRTAVDIENDFSNEALTLSAVIDYSMDWGTLTSITAITDYEGQNSYDIDRSQLDVMRYLDGVADGNTFSQELRLVSEVGDDFEYLVGLFYFEQGTDAGDGEPFVFLGEDFITQGDAQMFFPGVPTVGFIGQPGDSLRSETVLDTESLAAFGQATWHVTDIWSVTGGLRWTTEDKDARLFTQIDSTAPSQAILGLSFLATVASPIDEDLSRSDTDTTWLLSTSYNLAADTMIFATVSTGSKSGGFNTVNGSADEREFDAETTTNYELGIKSTLLDSRLRINAAAFFMEVDDYQFQQQLETGIGTVVANEAAVETSGLDMEIQVLPLPNLTLGAGLLYMHDYEITEGPQAGNDLPFVADISYNLSATFFLPVASGGAYLRADYAYMDDHLTITNNQFSPDDFQDRETLNAKLGWRNKNWNLSVWGRNLTDNRYSGLNAATLPVTGMDAFFLAPPRTWGATLRYEF